MRSLSLLAGLLLAVPAAAQVTVTQEPRFVVSEQDVVGICTDVATRGNAAVDIRVKGRSELGHVKVAWDEGFNNPALTVWPQRTGRPAFQKYLGQNEAGQDQVSTWVPTTVPSGSTLVFLAEVYSEGQVVARYELGTPPASDPGGSCAALN